MDALSLLHPWLARKEGGGREALSILPRLAHRRRGRGNGGDTRREEGAQRGQPHQWHGLHKGGVSVGVATEMVAGKPLCTPQTEGGTNGGGREKKGEGKKAGGGKTNEKNKVCFW